MQQILQDQDFVSSLEILPMDELTDWALEETEMMSVTQIAQEMPILFEKGILQAQHEKNRSADTIAQRLNAEFNNCQSFEELAEFPEVLFTCGLIPNTNPRVIELAKQIQSVPIR